MPAAAAPPKPKKGQPVDGMETGDTVYVRHAQRGVATVNVVAIGKDGFQGIDESGARVKVRHPEYLGHKTRLLHTYSLVDEGADGVVVERGDGQRRFLRGELPKESENSGPAKPTTNDPLLSGLDELMGKALRPLSEPAEWLLKAVAAGSVKGRPGLTQRRITDRTGRSANRWVRAQPKEKKNRPVHKHGDDVKFRHEAVEGHGKIVGSGQDGVTIRDETGREHQVRHDAITPPPEFDERKEGEDDKSYSKRVVDKMDAPEHVPEAHDRYFNTDKANATVPLDKLVSTKSDEENAQGGENAPKRFLAAYHGKLSKRDPIKVKPTGDGKYEVTDGNGTLTAAKKAGWSSLPVQIEGGAESQSGPLFPEQEVAKLPDAAAQPVKTEKELFAKAPEAQDQLLTWLDKGKGVASKIGATVEQSGPSDTDLNRAGTMLFIAPVKSPKRAKEKVQSDYDGDWSKLIDPVRCSFACDNFTDLRSVLTALQGSGMKLARKPKDRFEKPTGEGYRDCLMNVTLPNGIVGEVQLHVKSMLTAKAEGHKWYEIQRELAAKEKKGELSSEDREKLLASIEAQKQIYGAAWKEANSTADKKEAPMTKALTPTGTPYTYYEHDNAYFRRLNRPGLVGKSIDDVLHGDKWVPYKGDCLKPAAFGDEVPDPLGGKKEAP